MTMKKYDELRAKPDAHTDHIARYKGQLLALHLSIETLRVQNGLADNEN